MAKAVHSYRVIFRGKLRNRAGGIPDYRNTIAYNKEDAEKRVKAMFKGDIKIDRVERGDIIVSKIR
jgi:hypothetical protein